MASRKLKHYFLGHPITVVSSAPLGDIIQNREATGRVVKWAIELGPHGLKYVPRTAIHKFLLMWISLLGFNEHLTNVVNRPLNRMLLACLLTLHHDGNTDGPRVSSHI